MDFTIDFDTMPPLESPTNTSASCMTSLKSAAGWSFAKIAFSSVKLSREVVINPFESHMNKCSGATPSARYNFAHEMADAPAPLKTTFTCEMSLFEISKAFNKAAAVMIAVPC
ncbi:MAG: Uncharacterised protein [Cryomorphaceae bacterium]|nr:MAG: Uncharacterised protein [Cryomorphaceae bacterium]